MTTTADVNTAFAAERSAQLAAATASQAAFDQRIADGKLRNLGNGRYQVTDPGSWDNGEILLAQNGSILPQHNLDMSTGTAALYTSTPAWHSLGNVIPGGTSDVGQVLELGGLNWLVERRTVRYSFAGELMEVPGKFVTVRDDTGAPLGVVGDDYTEIQHRDAFTFLQELVVDGSAIWESAGALRGGRKVFITMRLPESVTIDAGGINDQITPMVAVIDDHAGRAAFQAVVTPWRIVCGNTERFAVRDAVSRWSVRHTKTALDRLQEARRTLGLSLKYYEAFAAEETSLARTATTLAEFDALIDSVWALGEEPSKRALSNAGERKSALHGLFATETARVGQTAYAAERAVTDYLDHVAPKRALGGSMAAARATAILEGSSDELKTRAHQRLMLTVR